MLAALALTVAAAASAQTSFEEHQADLWLKAQESRRAASAAQDRETALSVTKVGMNCNDPMAAGVAVMNYIKEHGVTIDFADQAEAAKTVVANGRTTILLSKSLPASTRVYAALIADETARLMYAYLPATAERSYRRSATAARAFSEIGGSFRDLPMVDGVRVDAVKDAVYAWTTGSSEQAIYDLAAREGLPELYDLEQAADPRRREELVRIENDFNVMILAGEEKAREYARSR